MPIRRARRVQPPIENLETDPRRWFCLRVVARYLDLDERTVKARIDEGKLQGFRDGKWFVSKTSIRRYEREREQRAS